MERFSKYFLFFIMVSFCIPSSAQTEKGYYFYKKAKRGDAYYQCGLGDYLVEQHNYWKAVQWYSKAAEQGFAIAQSKLGTCYANGQGVAQDYTAAVYWYRKAAEKGNAIAQCNLGYCYSLGQGVPQDFTEAVLWYKKAADQGNFTALSNLATNYYYGMGVPRDVTQALFYYKKANESMKDGSPRAQYGIGLCYAYGPDYLQDEEAALNWFKKSANAGDALAQIWLGGYYQDKELYSQAEAWYMKAIDQKDLSAMNALAYMYAHNKSFSKAFNMINEAISMSPEDAKAYYLDSKGEIALIAGDKELAQTVWKEFKTKYPDMVMELSHEDNNVFVKTMLRGQDNPNSAPSIGQETPIMVSSSDAEAPDNLDFEIPLVQKKSPNTFAFVIANEEYKRVAKVPYATNDGNIFAEYCRKTLGIPDKNVKVWIDATLGDMKYVVDNIKQITEAYDGDVNIVFYYAGHGIPSDDQQNSYLLPVDGYGAGDSSMSLRDLYSSFGQLKAKSVIVFLDACFSGAQRDGNMLASTRGVVIKPKLETPKGNLIVLSAAQNDETALPYEEKSHGLFSYFLLKKLQESKGDCTLGELSDYIITNVKRTSISIGDKIQIPKVSASFTMGDWKNMKLILTQE